MTSRADGVCALGAKRFILALERLAMHVGIKIISRINSEINNNTFHPKVLSCKLSCSFWVIHYTQIQQMPIRHF